MKAARAHGHEGYSLRTWLAYTIVSLAGAGTLFAGVVLLLAPSWFFTYVGPYAPFNRHYEGDLGAFLLPLGAGLLYAARAPWRHRALVAVVAAGNLLHVGNHVFDSIRQHATLAHWLGDTAPLVVIALLLLWVAVARRPAAEEAPSESIPALLVPRRQPHVVVTAQQCNDA